MHVAHFIQRYPPALGGSEAYFARLGEYLVERGDNVTVWTTTAVELEEFWATSQRRKQGRTQTLAYAAGWCPVRHYPPLLFPARRYTLKALSLLPVRSWQCLTMPCNPICPGMW